MNHAENLVKLYREFYRADKSYNISARKAIQPVYNAFDIICRADSSLREKDALADIISGNIAKLMQQIRSNTALGRYTISNREKEREAIIRFSKYIVEEVFYGSFEGDVGKFAGKQRGLIEDSCEFLYKTEQDKENKGKEAKEAG